MGVYIDSISEFVYSVGEDKKFKVYDLRKNDLVAGKSYAIDCLLTLFSDITCGTALLTSIVPDKENKRAFISNRTGQVFIYDIGSVTPKFIHVIQAHPKGSIRGMYFDSYKNYLLTANYDDGYISMTDVQKPDRVKYSQVTTHLKGKKKVRRVI
jgi:DNA-binding beta-propeller fold protein YncE